jgi:hypothetical protein
LDRRLGGPQSRSGRGVEEKSSSPRQESNPDRPARSQSVYRLSYHGSDFFFTDYFNDILSSAAATYHKRIIIGDEVEMS